MFCLLYISNSKWPLSPGDLRGILGKTVEKNASLGITGVLMYHEGMFLQVLEGDEAVVRSLLETIRNDGRHTDLHILLEEPVTKRHFPDWAMAIADMYALSEEDRRFCRSLRNALPTLQSDQLKLRLEGLIERFQSVLGYPPKA